MLFSLIRPAVTGPSSVLLRRQFSASALSGLLTPARPPRSALEEELNPAIPASHAMAKFDVFMDQDVGSQTRIDSYSSSGFLINNVTVNGPVALLPELTLLWRPNAQNSLELSKDSLILFELLNPRPGEWISSPSIVLLKGGNLRRLTAAAFPLFEQRLCCLAPGRRCSLSGQRSDSTLGRWGSMWMSWTRYGAVFFPMLVSNLMNCGRSMANRKTRAPPSTCCARRGEWWPLCYFPPRRHWFTREPLHSVVETIHTLVTLCYFFFESRPTLIVYLRAPPCG